MFQFNIVLGIVIRVRIQRRAVGCGADAWRWMLGVAAVPSLIYFVMGPVAARVAALAAHAQERPREGP
jgi:hypothetical protein